MGTTEHSWGDVKTIKDGKRSHMGDGLTEKRAIVYTTARVNEARIRQQALEKIDCSEPDAMFSNADLK